MRDHKDIHKKLSEKYKLPVDVIEKIVDSQFEFTKEVISKGNDDPIRLQYLGVFQVKFGRRKYVEDRRERLKKLRDGNDKAKQKE